MMKMSIFQNFWGPSEDYSFEFLLCQFVLAIAVIILLTRHIFTTAIMLFANFN